jgi:phosphoesterase RecJ-like protein
VVIGVLIEERVGTIKASLRGMESVYRMDTLAAQFNGGGHANAAGLNWKGNLADFYAKLLAAITQRLNEVDAALK